MKFALAAVILGLAVAAWADGSNAGDVVVTTVRPDGSVRVCVWNGDVRHCH